MMTRGATVRDMNDKLNAALKELEVSRKTCRDLLQEREESEVEVKKLVDKNTQLKRQLVELHTQHEDIQDQHNHLRQLMAQFQECRDTHDQALNRISGLEAELCKAHNTLSTINSLRVSEQVANTDNLFNKLVGSASEHECKKPTVTIDLTGEDSLVKLNSNYKLSQNKIKKYAKLNKIIKRCKKQQQYYSENIQLRKERVNLINQLNNYQIKLEDSINIYRIDTERLQSEIQTLDSSLKSIYSKYMCSENQIREHILATNDLVDKVDSLTLCVNQCTCQRESNLAGLNLEVTGDTSQTISAQDCIPSPVPHNQQEIIQGVNNSVSSSVSSIMYSDSIGRGLGQLVSNCLPFSSQNHCTPQASYHHIMSLVREQVYDPNAIITVFVGNSVNVAKDDITYNVTELLKINCRKIILCAFPYFKHLTNRENQYIHMLNMHMQFLVSHYNNRFSFFDINNFVDKLLSTRYTVYLPIIYRRQIAKLLAYNIYSDIGSMSTYPIISCTISNSTNDLIDSLN
ncbi:hypothetical protein PYW08_003134 [Mythimna loreyi]|uniref:Uncharacterized protein n=1 Tax=Mythimna loreyi TaxID=667449 RepID=A0ACC2QRC0_9NEOP|nr:hypothetical protein PYW08_003134 [Mythimna loreyi]